MRIQNPPPIPGSPLRNPRRIRPAKAILLPNGTWCDPYLPWPTGCGLLATDRADADRVILARELRRWCPLNRLMRCEDTHFDELRDQHCKN